MTAVTKATSRKIASLFHAGLANFSAKIATAFSPCKFAIEMMTVETDPMRKIAMIMPASENNSNVREMKACLASVFHLKEGATIIRYNLTKNSGKRNMNHKKMIHFRTVPMEKMR